jgi:hypothetical protein
VSKHFINKNAEIAKCEMLKNIFGVDFGVHDLECQNTSSQKCRKDEMQNTKK